MGKKKIITVVSKCQCNVCGQVAHVEPGTGHHFCHGIKLLPGKTLPAMFSGLTNATRKGTWELWVKPEVFPPYTQAEVDAGVAAMEEMMAASKVQVANVEPSTEQVASA